ncbi:hypothetical protein [Streptomyces sp. NPDC007088]|uniref:hypothetical protein n=1 Tax=Streptomyces sp. NPDC007088 TaxID=3364773 RepID=UPI0036A696CA
MLMRAGRRVPRSVLWRLALVTVVAGLLHLLGCAHGAQAAGLPRTDSLPVAAAAAFPHTHPAVVSAPAPCDHGTAVGCAGVDEPAAAGPRTGLPVPPATGGGPLMAAPAPAAPGRSRASRRGEGGEGPAEHGRTRAVLGVWRT